MTPGEGGTEAFADIKGPHAFLCHVCDGKLQSIARHEDQLRALKSEISTMLQSAMRPDTDGELALIRKRRSEGATAMNLTGKAPRLRPQPQGPPQAVYQQSPEQPVHMDIPTCSSSEVPTYHSSVSQDQPISQQQSPTISVCYICMLVCFFVVLSYPSGTLLI